MNNQYHQVRIGNYDTTHIHDENPYGRIIADWRVEGEKPSGLVHGEGTVIVTFPVENATDGTINLVRRTFRATDAITLANHIRQAAESTRVSRSKTDTVSD